MDILIKNMEMPVDHGIFLVICPSGTIEQKVGTAGNGYPIYNIVKDAKAIEISDRGSLVSKDEVLACISKRKDFAVKVNDEICADLCDLLTGDISGLVEANNE